MEKIVKVYISPSKGKSKNFFLGRKNKEKIKENYGPLSGYPY